MTLGLLSGCGYTRQPQLLHEQHTMLYLLSWAYSVCVLFTLLFQQHGVLCHLRFFFSFVFCRVLHRSLWEHNGAIPTTPEASLREQNGSISTILYIYNENTAETAEKYTCINFSQCNYCYSTNTNEFTVWRMNTYIYTYRHCLRSTC